MKLILEQIIDRNTEGNYLLSSSDKAQMISEILDLFGVIGSKPKSKSKKTLITPESYSKMCDIIKNI